MNKIYQTKFNKITGTTVACSELVRRACKVTATLTVLAASTTAFAQDCIPNADGSILVGGGGPNDGCNNVKAATVNQSGNAGFYILTRNHLREPLNVGDTTLIANINGDYTALGNQYSYGYSNAAINAGNLDFTVNSNGNLSGIASYHNVDITAKNVELNINNNYSRGGNSSGSVSSYGILAGSAANAGERKTFNGKYTTITVDKLTMNQTATGGKTQPILNNGIRAIQGAFDNSGDGSTGRVIVNDDLDMTLTGNRSIGIYVSGNQTNHKAAEDTGVEGQLTPIVVLNGKNNKIIINQGSDTSTLNWDSNGIKLGKTRNTGEGPGILESHGNLTIDTTNARNGNGIKMVRNSLFKANYDKSATTIKTNGYALEIGTHDDATKDGKYEQAAAHGVRASFKDAVFTTTGTSADPVIEGSVGRKDLIFVDQGQVDTNLSFSGDKTNLTAHNEGYIVNVSGNYTGPNYQYFSNTYDDSGNEQGHEAYEASSVTFNATGKGSMTGLVTKGTVKTEEKQVLDESYKPILNINLDNGFTWNLKKSGTTNTAKFDTLNLTHGSILNAAFDDAGGNEFILQGNVNNDESIINLDNASHAKYNDMLTIVGNYSAINNAIVKMNTLWNQPGDAEGNNSQSDVLKITGTATGVTRVIPLNADGNENVIDGNVQQVNKVINTVPVVYVGTSNNLSTYSSQNAFTGTAHTTGATEVQLAKRSSTDGDVYYWTMQAKEETGGENGGGGNSGGGETTTPKKPTPIYSHAVAGYVVIPHINQEQGFASISTLHERRGEHLTSDLTDCANCDSKTENFISGQTWGRVLGKHLKQDGKNRLNADSDIAGFQIGHDFFSQLHENGSHNHIGTYIAYSRASTDFSDQYRAVNGVITGDKYTGKGKSDAISLGITNTYYNSNNSYIDLVGQLSYLHNKYEARDGINPDNQNGWGFAISVEAGQPFGLTKSVNTQGNWKIEPQAQLIYQYINLNSFNDRYRHVDQNCQDALRGRVGVRVAYDGYTAIAKPATFYALGNVWHDFLNPSRVDIGRDNLREKFAKTWGELGIGLKIALKNNSFIYSDVRYEHDFGSSKREGYRGSLSFEHKWK